jgi:tetratricopeptide (TPR) repeat protein
MTTNKELQIEELDGYVQLGMRREATALARKLLEAPTVSAPEFERTYQAVVRMNFMFPGDPLSKLRAAFESAFSHLPSSARKEVQNRMLGLYFNLGDYRKAEHFVRPKPLSDADICLTLEVLTRLGRLTKAKRMARHAETALKSTSQPEFLHLALSRFYARIGDYPKAVEQLSEVNFDKWNGPTAAFELAEIKIADAIRTIRRGVRALGKYRDAPDKYAKEYPPGLDTSQSVNKSALAAHYQIRLMDLLENLEEFLPARQQKAFGL